MRKAIKLVNQGYIYREIKGRLMEEFNEEEKVSHVMELLPTKAPKLKTNNMFRKCEIFREESTGNSYLYNLETNEMKKWDKGLLAQEIKRIGKVYQVPEKVGEFIYKPEHKHVSWDDVFGFYFNSYKPPSWMKSYFYTNGKNTIKGRDIPEIYHNFFMHLTDKDIESYNYLVDWLANAVQDRNYCILTTIGAQGIGKGVLGEIMRQLFGPSNFYSGTDRMLKTNFNAQMAEKKLVYIDEVTIKNKEHEDRVKGVVNDYIEIEKKGIDAREIKNYASFYISSNNLDAIRISKNDRRFSIINLTDKKLNSVLKPEEIKELVDVKNTDKLGRFLWNYKIERDMTKVFISKRTEEVRESSLKEWEEYFIGEFAAENSGKALKQTDVSDIITEKYGSKFRPSRTALQALEQVASDVFEVKKVTVDHEIKVTKQNQKHYEGKAIGDTVTKKVQQWQVIFN